MAFQWSVVLRMVFLTSFRVVARQFIESAPFNVPVAMQSSLKAWQMWRSAFCAAQSCRRATDLWFLVASIHSIWSVWSDVSSHVESGARSARLTCTSSQFQHILGRCVEFDQPIPDPIHQPVVPPPPPLIWPVCCRRVGGPPDYSPLEDRRMEWSPIQPGASGGSSPWTFQWVSLTCSRTLLVEDVPPLPDLSCPRCQVDSGAVLDVTTGDVRRVCLSCNCVVTAPDPPQEDWFSCGPLCGMAPLYGWDARILSRFGEGLSLGCFVPSSYSGCSRWRPPSTFLLTPQVLVLQCLSANVSIGFATLVS